MSKEKDQVKVIFHKDFDFKADAEWRSIQAYYPDEKPQTVTRECAKKAVKAGCATYYEEAPKGESRKTKKKTAD